MFSSVWPQQKLLVGVRHQPHEGHRQRTYSYELLGQSLQGTMIQQTNVRWRDGGDTGETLCACWTLPSLLLPLSPPVPRTHPHTHTHTPTPTHTYIHARLFHPPTHPHTPRLPTHTPSSSSSPPLPRPPHTHTHTQTTAQAISSGNVVMRYHAPACNDRQCQWDRGTRLRLRYREI